MMRFRSACTRFANRSFFHSIRFHDVAVQQRRKYHRLRHFVGFQFLKKNGQIPFFLVRVGMLLKIFDQKCSK